MEITASTGTLPLKRWPIVMALLIGAFVSILNQTLMNVALPHMMRDLKVTETTIQWLVTGFMLVNGVLIPVSAYFMERFTTRGLFVAAMTLFTIGTVVCGIGTNFELVLTGRLIQAAGAGVLMPLMTVVFLTIFPIEKRGTIAGALGTALLVSIMSSRTKERVAEMILSAGINPRDPANAEQLAHMTKAATINGIDFAFEVATGITLAAFLLSFFIVKCV